jgi:hypothetical protein
MSIKVSLIALDGTDLHTEEYQIYGRENRILASITPQKSHGRFKTASFTVQATTILAQPESGGSVELTDLIITFEKKNTSLVTVRFYDGTNEAVIAKVTLTDAPVEIAIPFNGRWRGWANAYVDATVSVADAIGCVALGYVKHQKLGTQSYEEWSNDR